MSAVLDQGRDVPMERIALVDLLDRLLAGGVVIAGDLVISIAGVDLVRVSLRALITTVRDELMPDAPGREDHP
ncbi:gas vesicle protein [Actinomadura sp. 1N219]|uniref:gas vesicle protein n=1 Tax=Actinomadura sp. 1N219 TaxID=3375152 RepID=UPI0037B09959